MSRVKKILDYLSTSDREARLHFYEQLGFNMTICIRSIWSNPETSDQEKIESIKTINELSHRIFNWIRSLRRTEEELIDANCFTQIKNYAEQNDIAAAEIGAALNSHFECID